MKSGSVMTKEEFKKTEQFAIEEEQRENEWQKNYGEKMPEVIKEMNELLCANTEESKWKLHDKFLDKSFFEHYKQTDEVAVIYVVINIFEKERQANIRDGILDQGRDYYKIREYIQRLKFLLMELDFDVASDAGEQLVRFIKEEKTSTITIETMMTTVVMRPLIVSMKLCHLFEKCGMLKEMLSICNFIDVRFPGNLYVTQKEYEIYSKCGMNEISSKYAGKVNRYLEKIGCLNTNIICIQEKLWLLKYLHKEICDEVIKDILKLSINPNIWQKMIELEQIDQPEYYILLANSFVENKAKTYAISTLKLADSKFEKNDMILIFLADLYMDEGQYVRALEVMDGIEDGNDIVNKLKNICRKRVENE